MLFRSEVSLAVDQNDFYDLLKTALLRQNTVRVPRDEISWQRVARDFLAHFVPAVGQATALAGVLVPDIVFQIPARSPEWVELTVEVQGSGRGAGQLKAALAAETDARSKLRGRLVALELEPKRTLGELGAKHTAVSTSLDRALERARIIRTEYQADGSASVQLSVDLRTLWDDLKR